MAEIFRLANVLRVQPDGGVYASARLYFYAAGSLTAQTVYQDSACTVPHPQPVEANSAGVFGVIFLNPNATADYRYILYTSDGVVIDNEDNVPRAGLTQSQLGQTLYPRTDAENVASFLPTSFAYPPEGKDPRRYNIAGNFTIDDTLPFQALTNFLEGGTTPGAGRKIAYNGGAIRLLPGNYKFTDTYRAGGNVRILGEQKEACALSFVGNFSGKNCINLGPDQSGIYGYSGSFTMGTVIESVTVNSASNCEATINTAGAHQGCHLSDMRLVNVNKIGLQIGAVGGSAYFKVNDFDVAGGSAMDAGAIGIYSGMGSVVELNQISIQGAGGANVFNHGIHVASGSNLITDLHCEDTTVGVYIAATAGQYHQTLISMSANSSVGTMLGIASGYVGSVTVINMSVAAGSIGIQNDNTGEVILGPCLISFYSWSGTAGDNAIIHNAGPHIRAHKTSLQSIANNTVTKVTFPTEDSDARAEWATDTFTCKIPGWYDVASTVQLVAAAWAAAPRDFELYIYRNGSVAAVSSFPSQAALTMTRTISVRASIALAVGDTIDIRILQVSGGSVDTATSSATVFVTIDRTP